jgi:hypothetical protein
MLGQLAFMGLGMMDEDLAISNSYPAISNSNIDGYI